MVKMPSMASPVAPILLSACAEALMRSPLMVFDRTICIADICEMACKPVLAEGQQQGAKGVAIIKGNLWHEGEVLLLWSIAKGHTKLSHPRKRTRQCCNGQCCFRSQQSCYYPQMYGSCHHTGYL